MDIKAYIESGVIESYVLGLASPEEVAELEALALRHVEIKQATDTFAAVVYKQVTEEIIAPPEEIKQQLMATLADEFASAKQPALPINNLKALLGGTASNGKVIKMASFKFWRTIAAASIILLIISSTLNVYYYNNYTQTASKYQALLDNRNDLQAVNDAYQHTLNIIHDSTMQIVRMPGIQGKQNNMATVYWDNKTKAVYVYAKNLQQTPQGKQYQLWALVDGKPVDAGVIGDCKGVCKMRNIQRAQAFAITLENAGGSKQPTLTALYVSGKV